MILDEPTIIALADCVGCGRLFGFDPDMVPSLRVDPQTGLPPEMCPCLDRAECFARSVREPVCLPCRLRANRYRRRAGLPLWPVDHD